MPLDDPEFKDVNNTTRKRFGVEDGARFAYICETDLETLCECDLVAVRHQTGRQKGDKTIPDFAVDVFKEIVLPHIRKEMNESEHFAPLRQIYHALILATWFKKKLRGVPAFDKVFESIDSNNPRSFVTTIRSVKKIGSRIAETACAIPRASMPGPRPHLDHATPNAPAFDIADNVEFYQKYIRLFRNGVFRCARAEEGERPGEIINRLYFSGALHFESLPLQVTNRVPSILDSVPHA
jgi:hypothetical protein